MANFEFNLENNLFELHRELLEKIYEPKPYQAFFVYDPKKRHIHKAVIRDRVLHQAVFRILYPIFDKNFIFDSYSSRLKKGTHNGSKRLFIFLRKASKNWRKPVFILKCDIRKFFDSIDHEILFTLIKEKVFDFEALNLIEKILNSFEKSAGVGIPLGNVTSQLFANIYLNQMDQFIKHNLKVKYYLRYADDFVLVHKNKDFLLKCIMAITDFLKKDLKLALHPNKVFIRKLKQGIDFLGYIVLPDSIILRTKTKKRILKKIAEINFLYKNGKISREDFNQTIASYLGVLKPTFRIFVVFFSYFVVNAVLSPSIR